MTSRSKNKKTFDNSHDSCSENKKRRSGRSNEMGDNLDVFGDSTSSNDKSHPALKWTDPPSVKSSSPRKKRSLPLKPILIDEDGFELNDDAAEIREERRKKELELKKEEQKSLSEKDTLSTLNFSVLSRLSAAELKDHVMQCVKLSTENKITTKNAFALQLIDCMAYMMTKDKSNNDFSTMACTLDASAKIYSHRVDSICNDMSKLIDAFLAGQKKPPRKGKEAGHDDENDDNDSDDGDNSRRRTSNIHRLRRHKKNPVLMSEESLTAKPVDKNFIKNYMKLEVATGAFMSTSIWDPEKKRPTLEKGIPLLFDLDDQEVKTCEVEIRDFFTEEEFKVSEEDKAVDESGNSNFGVEELFVEAEKAVNIPENIVDAEISEEPADENWDFHEDNISLQESLHEEHNPIEEQKINCVANVIKKMEIDNFDIENNQNLAKRTESLQAIFYKGNTTSEYSYLEQKYSPVWTGPDYWKKSYKGRIIAQTKKGGKKKKGPTTLIFDIPIDKDLVSTVPQKLVRKTMLNWKEKKVTVPEDLHIDPNIFLQLFSRSKDKSFIHKLGKSAGYMLSHDLAGNNVAETTTYSPDLMAIEVAKDSPGDDFDDGVGSSCQADNDSFEDLVGKKDKVDRAEEEACGSTVPNVHLLEGSNLIDAPKMVVIEDIKYATRPNRVNMQELKRSLFDILSFDGQDKENGPQDESVNLKFSDVYSKLNKARPATDEEKNVSPSMAFLALLHLANENNLRLQNLPGDDTDFIISPEV